MFRSALDALGVLREMKDNGVALHMIGLRDTTTNGVSKHIASQCTRVEFVTMNNLDKSTDTIEFCCQSTDWITVTARYETGPTEA